MVNKNVESELWVTFCASCAKSWSPHLWSHQSYVNQQNLDILVYKIFHATKSVFLSVLSIMSFKINLLYLRPNKHTFFYFGIRQQRWSRRGRPQGHILKSLAFASKPQVLENCLSSALGQHHFLNRWNCVGKRQKLCGKFAKTIFVFLLGKSPKNCFEDLFFWDRTKKLRLRLFSWSSALSIYVLGLERVCPQKSCFWPWPLILFCVLALARSLCPLLHLCQTILESIHAKIQMQQNLFLSL